MPRRAEQAQAELIESVCASLADEVSPDLVGQREAFVRRFYRWVPVEDLAGRGIGDLRGAAMASWDFARDRKAHNASVRAYNPTAREHGWQSTSTVVEVVTDDMPFLVDSVGTELSRLGYGVRLSIVPVIDVLRDADGRLAAVLERSAAPDGGALLELTAAPDGGALLELTAAPDGGALLERSAAPEGGALPPGAGLGDVSKETVMQFEVDREPDPERLDALVGHVRRVLGDVRAAAEDEQMMRERMGEIAAEIESAPAPLQTSEAKEVRAFLEWARGGKFIFLGYREYDLVSEAGEDHLRAIDGTALGILRHTTAVGLASFARLPGEVRALARFPHALVLTKANSRSTVHRPLYLDYIGVKRFERGEVCGERRFLGLYTAAAQETNPRQIPILRGKVETVIRRAGFPPGGHQARELTKTLHGYPRDELFQITEDELFAISMGIVTLAERQRVRLFVRGDLYKRFVSCLVFVPRDRYNTENRERIASALRDAFAASDTDWSVHLSDSKLARLHWIVRTSIAVADVDVDALERRIAEMTRPWTGHLADALREMYGEERGDGLFRRYGSAFPIAYREDWGARAAVVDVDRAEAVIAGKRLVINVYQSDKADRTSLRCKLLTPGERIALSDVVPVLENMGLRVADERPYELKPEGLGSIWIYDIGVVCEFDVDLRIEATRTAFQDAFTQVWMGDLENDRLGALVLGAGLTGREVSLLRALVKYLRQAGARFSDRYLQQALTGNPDVARLLVELFCARLDPERFDGATAERLGVELEHAIDDIVTADRARILRDCLAIVRATVRTNHFRRSPDGCPPAQLAFKLDPSQLRFLPALRPRFETFIYSPRLEGVLIRSGRVARGGIRLSHRREDFRTEALGKLREETVKNAVIVPVGAKGVFVTKQPPSTTAPEALLGEIAECYRLFLSGLLDVTDNIVAGEVVAPPGVIRHDEDDAYLVVAPDEGTVSLSELANRVSEDRGFWLGDSFAAGGRHSNGGKGLGIAARGAWESVSRHFRSLGLAVRSDEFTVVGIGDLAGQALLSPHVRLVAAFDADHVFVDPDPDLQASLVERRRLFELPAASWRDYDPAVISEGGGVWPRSAGVLRPSAQVREVLGVAEETLTPDELIRALLRAPVDLLWNGGVGTFVKAHSETHSEIGDKANDAVRINGTELRCRVVGEARSGGFTQKGRIEYAISGGHINTDAIDTAAEVNCSDHEVNLKILLDSAVADREITGPQRDRLIGELEDAVAQRALYESYSQALALSLERRQAAGLLGLHARLIDDLEQRGLLDRELEQLPSDERIRELETANEGLTAPELSVLLAYAKVTLCHDLLESDVPEDEYLRDQLADSLPASLRERFRPQMRNHRVRREIITTDLANSIVDRQGTTFVYRLAEETGADTAHVARAYAVAVAVFEMRGFWEDVEALDDLVDHERQFNLLLQGRRLVTRATRWLVGNRRPPLDIAAAVADYAPGAASLQEALPELLSGLDSHGWTARLQQFGGPGVPSRLASWAAAMDALFFTFDIVESVRGTDQPVGIAGTIHFGLERRLELDWLRDRILDLPRADIWQTLARSALRDDLYKTHRAITAAILKATSTDGAADAAIDRWVRARGPSVERYIAKLRDVRTAPGNEFATLLVAVGGLADLISSEASPT
jgi:glutamate dehydrogenase